MMTTGKEFGHLNTTQINTATLHSDALNEGSVRVQSIVSHFHRHHVLTTLNTDINRHRDVGSKYGHVHTSGEMISVDNEQCTMNKQCHKHTGHTHSNVQCIYNVTNIPATHTAMYNA